MIKHYTIAKFLSLTIYFKKIIGKQDPFVIFRIGESIQKTKTDLRGGQHPTWDDQVRVFMATKLKALIPNFNPKL